jgi:hypothetical protein
VAHWPRIPCSPSPALFPNSTAFYANYQTFSRRAIQTRIRHSLKFKELDLRQRRDESEPSRCTVMPTGDFLESEARTSANPRPSIR